MRPLARTGTTLLAAAAVVSIIVAAASAAASHPAPPAAPVQAAAGGAAGMAPPVGGYQETVYVPLPGCRVADTRVAAAGKLGGAEARTFVVRGTSGFPAQGGTAGGCGVPAAATAVTANVGVAEATGSGFMRNYPVGEPASTSTFVNYWGDRSVSANPTLTLSAAGVDPHIVIRNFGSPAHVIIDVTGYYAPQLGAFVQSPGTIAWGTGRVTAASKVTTGEYRITFDRDVSRCRIHVTPYGSNYAPQAFPQPGQPTQATVIFFDYPSGTHKDSGFLVSAIC